MGLDLSQLAPQLEDAGRSAAQWALDRQGRLPEAEAALDRTASMEPEALTARIQRAGSRWSGALLTQEPPAAAFDPPGLPARLHVVAADGSQIYPDRHSSALYYLINVGGIHLEHGTGAAPQTFSQPYLYHEPEDLFDDQGRLITGEIVNGKRDVAEMAALAEHAPPEPSLALLDNGLILWILLQGRDHTRGQTADLLEGYLGQLGRLRQSGTALAGVVERPQSGSVLALAHLCELADGDISPDSARSNPYRSLSDRSLFQQRLEVGQRSARFIHGSPVNERFRDAGHEVQFFYLKSSEETLLRVEIPAWLADQPDQLELVHAGLLLECRATAGFPYALARAHELAVVTQAEREQLDRRMHQLLLEQGLSPRISQKSRIKAWSGGRRRHRV